MLKKTTSNSQPTKTTEELIYTSEHALVYSILLLKKSSIILFIVAKGVALYQ